METRYHASSIEFGSLHDILCSDSSIFDYKPSGFETNPNLFGISLKRLSTSGVISSKPYDIGEDNWICSGSWQPIACMAWSFIDVEAYVPDGTSISFRLSCDGETHFVWNGNSWVEAIDEWNNLEEVREGLSSWQVDEDGKLIDKRFRVVVNLRSEDGSKSPVVRRVNVVWEIDDAYNTFEDMIYDSLIPRLESLTAVKDWATDIIGNGTNSVILPVTDGYSIQSVESAYDHTEDPEHRDNIFVGYNSLTRRVTLSRVVEENSIIWVSFTYHPMVHVMTSTDVGVVEPPAIIIESIRPTARFQHTRKTSVKTGGSQSIVFPISSQVTFTIKCSLMMSRVRDIGRMRLSIARDFKRMPYLRSAMLDEMWDLRYLDSYEGPETATLSEIAEGTLAFDVLNVPQWDEEATGGFVVTQPIRSGLNKRED